MIQKFPDWAPGFATTTILILSSISLNSIFIGIIGECLGRIYMPVKRRPLAVVEREINFSSAKDQSIYVEQSSD